MDFGDIIRKLSVDDNTKEEIYDKSICNNTYKSIISYIISLPPKQYTLLSSLIGLLLIDGLEAKELLLLGKFINNIGHTIITAAAQEKITIKKDKHHDN